MYECTLDSIYLVFTFYKYLAFNNNIKLAQILQTSDENDTGQFAAADFHVPVELHKV